ncbi:carotenoid biosynthesis protein [bacterium]|nr:carotenoid biosynthesis protein [bacterium]
MKRSTLKTVLPATLLYLFLGLGGLWHVLGWFQSTMILAAGPILILLSLVAWLQLHNAQKSGSAKRMAGLFASGVILAGFAVETIGVKTGLLFGNYLYGDVLQPQVMNVPIAIGFAWLAVLLSAHAISQRLIPYTLRGMTLIRIVITSLLMVLFDAIMEPVAVQLGYWSWDRGIPLQNFIAWFLIGGLFAWLGHWLGPLRRKLPPFIIHLYLAQVIYFGLVLLGGGE